MAESPCSSCPRLSTSLPDPVDEALRSNAGLPGALIPVLQSIQATLGHLPEDALRRVALSLGLSFSQVAGVVGFYSYFSRIPRGRHVVRVCMGTACYVRGSERVLERFQDELDIAVGETTADRAFTLEAARCIGGCGLSPAVMVDEEVVGTVQPKDVGQILKRFR